MLLKFINEHVNFSKKSIRLTEFFLSKKADSRIYIEN